MGFRAAIVSLATAAVLLTGCAAAPQSAQQPTDSAAVTQLRALGIDASDPREIIERLDTLPLRDRPDPSALTVSVRPDALELQPGGDVIPLDTEFYLSIAPYVSQTHECTYHSPTTCLGELQNAPFEVTVTDAQSGEEVQRLVTATADNGFIGLWLPRDRTLTVRVVGVDGVAEQQVSTGVGDPTCITTMHLTA